LDDSIAKIKGLIWREKGAEIFEFDFVRLAVDRDFFAVSVPAWVVEIWEKTIAVLQKKLDQ
jgi:hypothetical protein